jgi:hypothetical protein
MSEELRAAKLYSDVYLETCLTTLKLVYFDLVSEVFWPNLAIIDESSEESES